MDSGFPNGGGGGRDWALVRRRCAATARRLFEEFDSRRRGVLLDVAREFYPIGVAGLAKGVEELADECPYDGDHRLLSIRPLDYVRKGAAGFHGNLTSPARRWFRLRLPSFLRDGGKDNHETTAMLDRLTAAVEWAFQRGNVYPALYKLYEHCLCFGFGCMVVARDEARIVKARTLRVGTYALGTGPDGQVCRVARRFAWTAEQILREFGDAGVPEQVREAARRGDGRRRFTVVNLIEPNATGDLAAYDPVARALALDGRMVYRSVYWLECGRDGDPQSGVVAAAGFSVKPIVAPRLDWELGDTYGRGRGMDGLDVARGLQSFQFDIYKVSQNKAQPAVIASSEFKDEGLKLGRGAVNYARFGESRAALVVPALAQMPDTAETRADRQDAERELADLFFNTAFATIDALKNNAGVKTATEIDALVRENMERLNPVVTNFDHELLDPLVSVVAKYTLQAGVCPLSDADLALLGEVNIEYVSQIHLAARQSQMSAVSGWAQFVGSLAGAKPRALDLVDEDGMAREYAEMLGVPACCVAGEDRIEEIRRERDEQEKQEDQMRQMKAIGDAARIGSMPTDRGHAGGILMRGLGGMQ